MNEYREDKPQEENFIKGLPSRKDKKPSFDHSKDEVEEEDIQNPPKDPLFREG